MKKQSVITLVIICSFIAGMFGANIAIKLFDKGNSYNSILTGDQILSLQKELKNIKKEKEKIKSNDNSLLNLEDSIIKTASIASKSIVSIIAKKDLVIYKSDPWGFFRQPIGTIKQKTGGGTGFFVTKDGKIITNKHVVSDIEAKYTIIINTGEEFEANVLSFDPSNDIAILKINTGSVNISDINIEPLTFIEKKDNIKVGQFAIAIGNKLGELENSVSLGIVSGKDRVLKENNINLSNLIQTDADIHPGNSGGALLNLKGEVIGINTATVNLNNSIGFAIQISKEKINYILNSIEKFGKIKRPFIGIKYIKNSQTISDEFKLRSSNGIYIINQEGSVKKGSNAARVGIEPGDIITEVDKIELKGKVTFSSIIDSKIPGDKVELKIIKPSGEIKRIKIILEDK